MLYYVVKLENKQFASYEQTDDLLLEVEPSILRHADVFNSYEDAEEFAIGINNRRDGEYKILSPENAIAIVEINESYEWLTEQNLISENNNSLINKDRLLVIKENMNQVDSVFLRNARFDISYLLSLIEDLTGEEL